MRWCGAGMRNGGVSMVLVTGGAASEKSEWAERMVCERARGDKMYLATMQPFGEAAEQRIARHRALRAGKGFVTAERACGLDTFEISRRFDGILLEDLGNLAANELFAPEGAGADGAAESILRGIRRLDAACGTLVIVSNEIFSDGVRYDKETARYMALLGRLNRTLAAEAEAVYESVCGILVTVKGGETG